MKRILPLAAALLLVAATTAPTLNAPEWKVDKSHSAINFNVKHFFTPVHGSFGDYDIALTFDAENLDESKIDVTIEVASVDTRNEKRNNHLMSGDFFNAEKYPTIKFSSESIKSTGDNAFVAMGKLTIRDVTKDFELPFTLLGVAELEGDMAERMGTAAIASFHATASLNRNDFGVGSGSWAATAVVGGTVNIDIAVEAGKVTAKM